MKNAASAKRTLTAAQRGQIVQRVLVDGRSSAAVAAEFAVRRQLVDLWVANFRRHGMASLRQDDQRTIASELVHRAVARPARRILRKIWTALHRVVAIDPVVHLRHTDKDATG
ncbi:MAG: helix-turn-helix domain-containing protein [Alphaproteobacteria bacterium]|nr:helix-turn-helix domain-containing protein [Alphaproteobacteria bacterium]